MSDLERCVWVVVQVPQGCLSESVCAHKDSCMRLEVGGLPTPWKKLCSITKDPGPPLPEDPGSAGLTGKSRQHGGQGFRGRG